MPHGWERSATVAVIGAGQAGLSAGYHLHRLGFRSAITEPAAEHTFVVFDANDAPGGAWQHRWKTLTMATVNGIFDLPGFPKPPIDDHAESRRAVPVYFADFEAHTELPILRSVTVRSVMSLEDHPDGVLMLDTDAGGWRARAIINATGTWNNPLMPDYPGADTFTGTQLHTRDYRDARDFAGKRVAIVGAGISALQQLEEISRYTWTAWYTRREPDIRDGLFRPEVEGRDVIQRVTADAEAGNPPRSVVSYTGLPRLPYVRAAQARGALEHRPMFTRIEPNGVREADGSFTSVEVILWATGFRPDVAHLEPLQLHNDRGGIQVRGTEVVADSRVHLIGYGPSQSTVGANRAGRDAARSLKRSVYADSSSTISG